MSEISQTTNSGGLFLVPFVVAALSSGASPTAKQLELARLSSLQRPAGQERFGDEAEMIRATSLGTFTDKLESSDNFRRPYVEDKIDMLYFELRSVKNLVDGWAGPGSIAPT